MKANDFTMDKMVERAADWSETGDLEIISSVNRAVALSRAEGMLEAAGLPELLEMVDHLYWEIERYHESLVKNMEIMGRLGALLAETTETRGRNVVS